MSIDSLKAESQDLTLDLEHDRVPKDLSLLIKTAIEYNAIAEVNGSLTPRRKEIFARNWEIIKLYFGTDHTYDEIYGQLPYSGFNYPRAIQVAIRNCLKLVHQNLLLKEQDGYLELPAEIRIFEDINLKKLHSGELKKVEIKGNLGTVLAMLDKLVNPEDIFEFIGMTRRQYNTLWQSKKHQKNGLPQIYSNRTWAEQCLLNNINVAQVVAQITRRNNAGLARYLSSVGLITDISGVLQQVYLIPRLHGKQLFLKINKKLAEEQIPTGYVNARSKINPQQNFRLYFLPKSLETSAIDKLKVIPLNDLLATSEA